MKPANVPPLDLRYWVALALASVFGANTGDFAAHDLHLGHALGLLPLAAIFAGIVFAERRTRSTTEAFYWFAIVTVRTAATNIGDLLNHDLRIETVLLLILLGGAFAMLALADRDALRPFGARDGASDTGARYWATMLAAGVLGTVLGDYLADGLGLDAGPAALIDGAALVLLVGLGRAPGFGVKGMYWMTVIALRTLGTNVGDWMSDGIGLGLATALSGIAFGAVVALWRPQPAMAGLQPA